MILVPTGIIVGAAIIVAAIVPQCGGTSNLLGPGLSLACRILRIAESRVVARGFGCNHIATSISPYGVAIRGCGHGAEHGAWGWRWSAAREGVSDGVADA